MIFETIKNILKWTYEFSKHQFTQLIYAVSQFLFRTQTHNATERPAHLARHNDKHKPQSEAEATTQLLGDLATTQHRRLSFLEEIQEKKENLSPTPQPTAAEVEAKQKKYLKDRIHIQAKSCRYG
ncbi:hypothetical protein CC99x_009290 [Candidatus Berkiella cookevillensis]|nr:hypothetical protein [Candidatus Berkiella cookevillensis]MCS5709097.1 hypothetical protein [Candidatus Berkiella cookevillensis]